jgi:DNA-binding response OmpR family regulator
MIQVSPALRVAIIDNDSGFIQVLSNRMDAADWRFRVLASAVPSDELIAMKINVAVINLAVLGGDEGWSYLEHITTLMPDLGVLVCYQNGTAQQRIRGLRAGADDWIDKPCHAEEVIARIEAVARRRRRLSPANESTGPVVKGELELRGDQFQVFVGGQCLNLTKREFELLQLLADREGSVLDRESIYERVWGYQMVHGDRSVDVFILKLRNKLEKASPNFAYVHTHIGVGYRFSVEPAKPNRKSLTEPPARAAATS